jgi:hypothetical protein
MYKTVISYETDSPASNPVRGWNSSLLQRLWYSFSLMSRAPFSPEEVS